MTLPVAAQAATGTASPGNSQSGNGAASPTAPTNDAGISGETGRVSAGTGGSARAGGGSGPASVWLLCLPAGVSLAAPFLIGTDISCAP